MIYYKIKPEFDNKRRSDGSILVSNELYTEREMTKYGINHNATVKIEIPKSKVYFMFGARFNF